MYKNENTSPVKLVWSRKPPQSNCASQTSPADTLAHRPAVIQRLGTAALASRMRNWFYLENRPSQSGLVQKTAQTGS